MAAGARNGASVQADGGEGEEGVQAMTTEQTNSDLQFQRTLVKASNYKAQMESYRTKYHLALVAAGFGWIGFIAMAAMWPK